MKQQIPPEWSQRQALDRAHIWHPFTQMKLHEADPPTAVVAGEGSDLLLGIFFPFFIIVVARLKRGDLFFEP